jgi:hypothetical protein
LEDFIAYRIDLLFAIKTRRVNPDVFEFYSTVLRWAELTAELVSLYILSTPPLPYSPLLLARLEFNNQRRFPGPSATLGAADLGSSRTFDVPVSIVMLLLVSKASLASA